MKKIVAIGGGTIGKTKRSVNNNAIVQEIIALSGKAHPKVLFIPTASSDSEEYVQSAVNAFVTQLTCHLDILYLIKEKSTKKEIEQKIFTADIIFVGGGNTLMMMNLWRKLDVDTLLTKALNQGIVLCGQSAGSICWFRQGNSDSRRFKNPKADLIKVRGLNFINALHCPHYDVDKDRRPGLKKMMKKTSGVAIAIDDCCALEIVDDTYRIISSKPEANAYKVYWKHGIFYEATLAKTKNFAPLAKLLKK